MKNEKIRFMRIILFFDLPVTTAQGRREYRRFVKYLDSDGFIRIQESVFSKLCINADSAKTIGKRVMSECPEKGDVRFLVITETQYQNITNVNESYSLREKMSTINRCIMIGGMNDED